MGRRRRGRVQCQSAHVFLDRETWDRYVRAEAVERESIVQTVSAWRALAGVEAGA